MARRGRPSKGAEALKHQVCFRLNDADHLTYLKLGGAAWFREQLQACRVRIEATPTAHRPFPLMKVTFTNEAAEPFPGAGFTLKHNIPSGTPLEAAINIQES